MNKLRVLDRAALLRLNQSSIRAGRRQSIAPETLALARERVSVNFHQPHQWAGGQDVRLSIVLDNAGHAAWLDVSPAEFATIREVLVSEVEWSGEMCAGAPPPAP
ncbi:MAG: hypothetical protein HYY02_06000 [Chloroflexi bacterium]|nr:hypothetical protein [Chloroflexota bacterium]